jgi:hypothetical protein
MIGSLQGMEIVLQKKQGLFNQPHAAIDHRKLLPKKLVGKQQESFHTSFLFERQRSLQYLTSSQTAAHFLRHEKGR